MAPDSGAGASRNAKRILACLIVLAVGGYLAFETGLFSDRARSREAASALCSKVAEGLPVEAALALAREHVTQSRLHIEVDEMMASFRGGCHCSVAFKGGKAFPRGAFCTD